MLAKHTKHLSLVDVLSIGIDRIQRNFEPMKKQVEAWKATRIPDEAAKLVIYRAFVEGELDVPKPLARRVHHLYFNPQIEEFAPRTTWSLSNAFTIVFKKLDPIPEFKATAKLASLLAVARWPKLIPRSRAPRTKLALLFPERDFIMAEHHGGANRKEVRVWIAKDGTEYCSNS